MRLYKRGDTWHYDFTFEGERHRGTTGASKKALAVERAERRLKSLELRTVSKREPATLGEVADRWFAARAAEKKSATTIAQRLLIMLRHMGRETRVDEIGTRLIEEAIQARRLETTRQGKLPTNSTVNRDIIDTTLRPVLGYAKEIMEEPVRDIRWSKLRLQEPAGRTRTFTAKEMAAWREALPEHHRVIFDFVARYGVRLSEAFFPPSAVDLDAGEVRLRDRKNGLDHTIPLFEADISPMTERTRIARAGGLRSVWWFRDEKGELRAIHWRAFQSASKAALKKAGIADARPVHDLRHHAATTMLRSTDNLAIVKKLLGHEAITSTARYAHANQDDLRRALRAAYGTPAAQNPAAKKKAK